MKESFKEIKKVKVMTNVDWEKIEEIMPKMYPIYADCWEEAGILRKAVKKPLRFIKRPNKYHQKVAGEIQRWREWMGGEHEPHEVDPEGFDDENRPRRASEPLSIPISDADPDPAPHEERPTEEHGTDHVMGSTRITQVPAAEDIGLRSPTGRRKTRSSKTSASDNHVPPDRSSFSDQDSVNRASLGPPLSRAIDKAENTWNSITGNARPLLEDAGQLMLESGQDIAGSVIKSTQPGGYGIPGPVGRGGLRLGSR